MRSRAFRAWLGFSIPVALQSRRGAQIYRDKVNFQQPAVLKSDDPTKGFLSCTIHI